MSAKHTDAELECCEEHIVHTDAVMAARSAMPAEEITTAASDFFKAFSDKTRLRILAALVSAAGCGVTLLATAHGAGREDLSRRKLYRGLLEEGVFRRLVRIRREAGRRIYEVEVLE